VAKQQNDTFAKANRFHEISQTCTILRVDDVSVGNFVVLRESKWRVSTSISEGKGDWMARYECSVCGYIYDEEQEGMSWNSLPDNWICPGCGSDKSLFHRLDDDKVEAHSEVPTMGIPNVSVIPVPRNTAIEPTLELIHALAREGLEGFGHHGPMGAMGVPWPTLPQWNDIQLLPAQLATKPLAENIEVGTELVIGPNAKKPLRLKMPIVVSDMSFGALSQEAKTALARGAELARTGIASGEGGMLPEEKAANSRYLFELGSAKFGYSEEVLSKVQAFHFKAGQAAKTGTGGHLPGNKVTAKIAAVRKLPEGQAAISPPTFSDLTTAQDFKRFSDQVRERTGGIPIGMKMSAQHIEDDIEFALQAGVDYIILDGRGGATGAAPLIFRDHISVPTIPALARARRYLDQRGRTDITLIITGGLRTPVDFVKALCLGADGIAVANAALQAIGCVAARICNTNDCPSGIATQKEELRAKLNIDESASRLCRFLTASVELMKVMARACGHTHLNQFNANDITTWKREMAELTGIKYAGVGCSQPWI
jgi:methylamine---glutamate N-methyltransferase subunit C